MEEIENNDVKNNNPYYQALFNRLTTTKEVITSTDDDNTTIKKKNVEEIKTLLEPKILLIRRPYLPSDDGVEEDINFYDEYNLDLRNSGMRSVSEQNKLDIGYL